jgi:hypothetical protein
MPLPAANNTKPSLLKNSELHKRPELFIVLILTYNKNIWKQNFKKTSPDRTGDVFHVSAKS